MGAIGRVGIGRHFEVVGRGLVAEYPAGQVECGAVARAVEAAFPVGRQARLRAGRKGWRRRAAQVRADTHTDEEFRLARTEFVFSIWGCEAGAIGIGVGHFMIVVFSSGWRRVGKERVRMLDYGW